MLCASPDRQGLTTREAGCEIRVFPLPMGHVGVGNAWIRDFLVTIAGRMGVTEVVGPHRRGRSAADDTRERHVRNCGTGDP